MWIREEQLTATGLEKPRPKYVLEYPGVLSDQARDNLRDSLADLFGQGKVVLIEEGAKLRPIDGGELPDADIVDVTHMSDTKPKILGTGRRYIYRRTGERMYQRFGGRWMTEKEKQAEDELLADIAADEPDILWNDDVPPGPPWVPRHAWKLALATAAVWVAVIVTGVW
jgi:hypothetical protein